jgi:hypothetical protein
VVDEEEHDAGPEQEEDVLGQGVGRPRVADRIHDRGDDQQSERGRDGEAGVEPSPHRVEHVGDEEAQEDLGVRKRHALPRAASGRWF